MKRQKLVYCCHAWHLVWSKTPVFPDKIEAWANESIVLTLYEKHKNSLEAADNEPLTATV